MKIAICLFVVILVVSVESLDFRSASQSKRGFRTGAADRFSHGFGKRNDYLGEFSDENVLTTEEMSELLRTSPQLRFMLIKKFMDVNGDGFINKEELSELQQ